MRAKSPIAADSRPPRGESPREFAAHFHLLGCVNFEDCLTLQRRLAYDALTRGDGRLSVLICEYPPLVTIGRAGSRAQVRLTADELAARQLEIRHVGRGGGAVLHGPGQLAVNLVLSLDWHRLEVGMYLHRLQAALAATLDDLKLRPQSLPGTFSLAGRTGVLAAVGAAIRHGVTTHGAVVNVNPDMRDQSRVQAVAGRPMTSILSERPLPVKMTAVRAALVAQLATAFGCQRHHLHTGHPHLAEAPASDFFESAA